MAATENRHPLFSKMEFIEQYATRVSGFSSRYNNSNSVSYSPYNIPGRPTKYPNYGDYPDTYMLRDYGKWWKNSEGAQRDYTPQDVDDNISEDYVELSFEYEVFPTSIIIYETYNPGAVVRIYGSRTPSDSLEWTLLYEGRPEVCTNAARRFEPQLKPIKNTINEIRIEFNQSLLKYHTAIDAVLLAGYKTNSELRFRLYTSGILPIIPAETNLGITYVPDGIDYFETLPPEVVVHIFQHLNLKSLTRCAQVNKRWNKITLDPSLYRAISLKKYWNKVDDRTLDYYNVRCKNLKKLDLSWCCSRLSQYSLATFLKNCGTQLTHLSLTSCKCSTKKWLKALQHCKKLKELRLKNCDAKDFSEILASLPLTELTVLDLSSTVISDQNLISILQANADLKHLNIDLCEDLQFMDRICETISLNNPNLITLSAWKTTSLTAEGVRHLGKLKHLRELDLGWCLMTNEPADCLDYIATGCKDLRRLIVSNWRGLNDHHLLGILGCAELRQLDLMGIKSITYDFCRKALALLAKLELLEISFCDGIEANEANYLRDVFKHVVIQRSCEFSTNDYGN